MPRRQYVTAIEIGFDDPHGGVPLFAVFFGSNGGGSVTVYEDVDGDLGYFVGALVTRIEAGCVASGSAFPGRFRAVFHEQLASSDLSVLRQENLYGLTMDHIGEEFSYFEAVEMRNWVRGLKQTQTIGRELS